MTVDERYMRRALELAELGCGMARPNPMVGAVLVYQDRIIGEGYHHRWGEPHAEVMAIRSVQNQDLLPMSTLYVTLEPCSHYGKTPPCAELIIRSGIRRVVVAMTDPYPEVSGRGVRMLQEQGIDVEMGVLQAEALELNRAFVSQHSRHRPYITLKWAQTQDGYIDRLRTSSAEAPQAISSPLRLRYVHRTRRQHQAILVGYQTALMDNPTLTNRYSWGRHPARLVIDQWLGLPHDLRLVTTTLAPTYILYDPYQVDGSVVDQYQEAVGASVLLLALEDGSSLAERIVKTVHKAGIQSVLVEGGAKTLQSFISSGLYDQIRREVSSINIGQGVPAPKLK